MAQRGMLPKIRKTAQAAQPVARPTIRPVRVTKAPPPPAPPRKFPSGVAPRGSHEAYPEQQAYADPPETREPTTKNGYEDPPTMSAHGAPMPKANANAVGPSSSSIRFDDETQMRQPDGRLIAASRHPAPVIAESRQDDETMARSQAPVTQPYFPPQDEHTHARNDHHLQPLPAPQQPDIYDSLPSLEIRRPYDTYEREFEERDPATQYGRRGEERHDAREHGEHAEHYPAPLRDEHHDSYDHAEHAPETQHMPQAHAREGSGARERPRMQSSQRRRNEYEDSSEQHHAHHEPAPVAYEPPPATRKAYEPAPSPVPQARTSEPAPRYEEPIIPPAPRVPAGFIVGVQPLRQPQTQAQAQAQGGGSFRAENNESFPPYAPHVQPPAPSPRGTYEPMQPMHAPAHVGAMHQSPMHGTPSMHQGLHQQPAMVHRGHPAMPYAQPAWSRPQPQIPTHPGQRGPVGHQLQDQPSATSRTLRFAWFVFGVAFGIGFTFFASGVVPGLKREEPAPTATAAPSATFPPAAPILSNAPPPVQAPPVQAAPPVAEAQAAPVQAPVQAPAVQAPPPVLAPPPADNTALAGVTPGQLPQAKAAQTGAPAPAQARVASAPAPAPRTTRRASAPSGGGSSAPRALPNSGSVEASDGEGGGAVFGSSAFSSSSSSSAPAKTAAVPSDLFGAALNP